MATSALLNPFRPGAGHEPPYLAGRQSETNEFMRLIGQDVVLENMVLTGLRGMGKTVLLERLKELAIEAGWGWVGSNFSEAVSVSEERLALRIVDDLALVTSNIVVGKREFTGMGFRAETDQVTETLNSNTMRALWKQIPGLASDKLKAILELVWRYWRDERPGGLIFAYDEAQMLSDHAAKDEYPLSLLLDVFESIQKRNIPFMLVLVGLPTLFPKLVEARTFAERMFRVVFLDRLNDEDSRDAILKPIEDSPHVMRFRDSFVQRIIEESSGYPYFIQFICKEIFDMLLQQFRAAQTDTGDLLLIRHPRTGEELKEGDKGTILAPISEITNKLDIDFYAGRWARATDRQRELLIVIAHLDGCESQFTVQEVVEKSKELEKSSKLLKKAFSPSHVSQMLSTLCKTGLIYKNRHGKYSFAVPLLGRFIRRQVS